MSIQLPNFTLAWADVLSQIDLHAVSHVLIAVLVAHDETCVECHNADMRARCPLRLALVATMECRRCDPHPLVSGICSGIDVDDDEPDVEWGPQ